MRPIYADEMSRKYAHCGESHAYDANDLDDMKAAIQRIAGFAKGETDFDNPLDWQNHRLAEMPTLDVVPVIRCRNCRYWQRVVDAHTHWVCRLHSYNDRLIHTAPDFYCADGKRRDGACT